VGEDDGEQRRVRFGEAAYGRERHRVGVGGVQGEAEVEEDADAVGFELDADAADFVAAAVDAELHLDGAAPA
jgi:hypothetical protein